MVIYTNSRAFQGIIQLRPFDEKVYEWIKQEIDNDPDQFINKEDKVRGGVDIYVSSSKKLVPLGSKLKKLYNAEIKLSRSLHGMSRITSKQVYRLTMLCRLKK